MKNKLSTSVLIVEDERIVGRDLQYSLRELGYDAFALASSADEAVKRCAERRPDIVLMDIRIRGSEDGIEAARRLRDAFDVPVVFLTAHADASTVERARRSEPYGYLLKPLKIGEVRSAIEIAIYKHANECSLRAANRLHADALHSMVDPVICVDEAGRVTVMNEAAEALTGVDRRDAIGFSIDDVVKPGAAVGPSTTEIVNSRSGSTHVVRATTAPVLDGGRSAGTVLVLRDVTQEKMAQRQLEIARRLDALATMVSGVAHEVNNPLAVIMVNSGFVQEELGTHLEMIARKGVSFDAAELRRLSDLKRLVGDLRGAASAMAKVISDLWTFSLPTMRATSSSSDLGRAAAWATRTTAPAFEGRATVAIEVPEGVVVAAEDHQLGQVLVNLLTNAAHAIPPGDVAANLVTIRARTENSRVHVDVTDTGSGIPDELQERIFDPFFSTKPEGIGRGLGLAIVQGIVTAASGSVRVRSAVGAGATFSFDLPVARAPAAP